VSAVAAAWLVAAVAAGVAAVAWAELRRRRELVARACHELRGPLTAAHLALHAARPAAVGEQLERAALALDDLAAARRGRRGGDRDEVVDIGELLACQADTWEAVAPAYGCRLRLRPPSGPARVRGDRRRLGQAVANLLANALEHGAGTVELSAHVAAGRLRIEVADQGTGLARPVALLTRDARGGTGARGRGLAIVSEVARRHGGRLLTLPSSGGARLAIELPATPAGHPARRQSAEEAS
jgi:signal transduction histidine kinase